MEKGISVVLLTRNEERNIDACLRSCVFADEIIVVDDGSDDRTVEIAEQHGARIFHRVLNGDWGAQKNFGIKQARFHWVFLIDADERVTPDLAEKIRERAGKPEDKAYWVQRHNRFQNIRAEHGNMRPDWVCRLVPRKHVHVYGQVHEEVRCGCPSERIGGDGLIHYPYRTWGQYVRKMDAYAEFSARKYLSEGRSISFWRDVVFRPFWSFIKIYFINGGFLDGKAGFMFSANNTLYTMNKYIKYYFLKNHNGEL